MKRIHTLFLLLLISLPLMAQKNMMPDDLMKFQRISNEQISADGRYLAFLITRIDVKENKGFRRLELKDMTTGQSQTLVGEEFNPSQISFSPDGKHIGFISGKDKNDQLWEVPLTGGEPIKITQAEDGITLYLYSPTGDKLLIGRRIKMDETLQEKHPELDKTKARLMTGLMYRHWNTWSDYSYNHLFITDYKKDGTSSLMTDLLKDEKFHAPTMPFGGTEEIAFSPDGKRVLYTCKKLWGTPSANSTNTDIYEYDIASGNTRNLSEGNKGYDKSPAFGANGKYLAWLSMEREGNEADKNRIILMEVKGGRKTDLTANFIYSVDAFSWSPTQEKIYYIATIEATHQIFEYDLKTKTHRQVTTGDHDFVSLKAYAENKTDKILAGKMSISYPTTLVKISSDGTETSLESINSGFLKTLKMGRVEKRMIKSTDGKDILTWVIYPPDFSASKKYPALLYCQGGPQSPVSQFFSYRWNFQLMAAQGYIVIAPNRRGLPGFGQEWTDQIKHDYGGQAMQDLLSASDALAAEPFVNKEKMGAVGASFGGYSVYWLAGNHNKRFKAFISHCGMFNMESWYGTTEEMFFANDDNGPYWLDNNRENYRKHSPHQYVDKWDTPILVIHNELDYRVPLSEGMQAFTAAQQRHIPSRFLYFPDEGHWVSKPQNSLLWQKNFFEWLDMWLK